MNRKAKSKRHRAIAPTEGAGDVIFERFGAGTVRAILPQFAGDYWEVLFECREGQWHVLSVMTAEGPEDFERMLRSKNETRSVKPLFQQNLLGSVACWAAEHQKQLFEDIEFCEGAEDGTGIVYELEDMAAKLLYDSDHYARFAKNFAKEPGNRKLVDRFLAVHLALVTAAREAWDCRTEMRKVIAQSTPQREAA